MTKKIQNTSSLGSFQSFVDSKLQEMNLKSAKPTTSEKKLEEPQKKKKKVGKTILKSSGIVLAVAVVAVIATYTILKFCSVGERNNTSAPGSNQLEHVIDSGNVQGSKEDALTDSFYEDPAQEMSDEEKNEIENDPFAGIDTDSNEVHKKTTQNENERSL